MNNKYLECINNKLVLRAPIQIEHVKLLSQINDLMASKTQMISVKNRILKFTWEKNSDVFYIDYLKCSGTQKTDNKRLQIPTNKGDDFRKGIPIGVYYSESKSYYVLFDNKELSLNLSSSNRSIWVDFNYIYKAIKNQCNLKYMCIQKNANAKYWIYISSDINLLINRNFDNFRVLSNKEIQESKKEIDIFKKHQKKQTFISEEINDFVFTKMSSQNKKKQLTHTKYYSEDGEIGRIGERLFNTLLEKKDPLVMKNLKLKSLDNFKWNNEYAESFLPYDFLINGKIYIDIKTTTSKINYFILSDTEYKFKKAKDIAGEKYYIVNITDVLDETSRKWFFLTSKEIDSINCIQKTERIYGEKYEK